MHSRLLSFLSDFERAILADDPAPEGCIWETERTANYRSGLARLELQMRTLGQTRCLRGSVLLQSFKLAGGAGCLKMQFSWADTETVSTHAVFAKPGCDWKSEARRLAALWLAGPPANEAGTISTMPPMAVSVAVAATG